MKIIILIFLLAFVNLHGEYWNQFDYSKLSKSEKLELREKRIQNQKKADEFNKENGIDWKISWHSNTKHMRSATSRIEKINSTDSLFIVMFAEEMLSDFLPFIGINRENLILSRVDIDPKRDHFSVKYKQHVNGIHFEQYGKISVIYNSKGMLEIGNNCFANFRMNTIPSITTDEAWEIVKKNDSDFKRFFQTNGEKYGTYNEDDWMKRIELVFFSASERNDLTGKPIYEDHKLAYKVILPRRNYYIDAINGDIIFKYLTEKY